MVSYAIILANLFTQYNQIFFIIIFIDQNYIIIDNNIIFLGI
jgi:hypothetical protein